MSARPDVLEACRKRDLGAGIEVLGSHGLTQGRMASLTGISQGRLSEYKRHTYTPRATSIFEDFANCKHGLDLAAASVEGQRYLCATPGNARC